MENDNLWEAISDFEHAPLREGAVKLLREFGLESDLVITSEADGIPPQLFLERHPVPVDGQKLTLRESETLASLVRRISVVFQVSEEESNLLPSYGDDGGILAHSIIFVAMDLHYSSRLTQGELQIIIRALNKRFGPPVIGLFRYKKRMAFATMAHRQHKRQPEKDVLFDGGVTMHIRFRNIGWKHKEFLAQWRKIIMFSAAATFGDVIQHLVNVLDRYRMQRLCRRSTAPDILRLHVEAICHWPLLTKLQEQELAKNIKHGGRDKFIYSNLRLVIWIATRYSLVSSLDILDLLQAGTIGLMTAVDKFNPERGYKFSTHAYWWIRHEINRAIVDNERLIRLPVHVFSVIREIRRVSRRIWLTSGIEALPEDIAKSMDLPKAKVDKTLEIVEEPVSLEFLVASGEYEDSVLLEKQHTTTPFDVIASVDLKSAIRSVLGALTEREATVLKMRFGIGMESGHTLEAIGKKFGVTRERIRQIEAKALSKLRHPSHIGELRCFVE